ncbi:hypothetical protein [Geodermatophilus poikilotrophus]|uniref:Uncharacterized protein n=1 Tax=Geodermatophilus poikilotrophus TaxID=1333667 RepID=A0A1I0HXB4_9ACTN|nr:hypothetical protein [Geodermatophilus poikilotrophus]SET87951.1 hypothetical protein SAMN04488546_4051 [Geodermatophilus poikilotrophus]
MTTPETNGPGEPTGRVSVSTAPPPAPRRWWSAVPHHLGRARTSTVVLALLFVGVYTLYLHVRPPDPVVAPAQEPTVQTRVTPAPAEPAETAEPTPSAPTSAPTTADTATPPAGTTGGEAPAESAGPAPTPSPEQTAPAPPTAAPTATAVPTVPGAPGT